MSHTSGQTSTLAGETVALPEQRWANGRESAVGTPTLPVAEVFEGGPQIPTRRTASEPTVPKSDDVTAAARATQLSGAGSDPSAKRQGLRSHLNPFTRSAPTPGQMVRVAEGAAWARQRQAMGCADHLLTQAPFLRGLR